MFDIPLRRRIQRLWLTEALRNKELEGTVDDGDAMRRLVADPAMQDATDEQLILQRTESLASTNPLATSLLENTRLLVSSARYTFLMFCIAAFFLGITTATAFFAPGTPVNIGMAWLMLVGINLVSLLFIVLAPLLGNRSLAFSLARVWIRLLEMVGRKRDGVLLVESFGTLISRSGSLASILAVVSHTFWLIFALSSMVATLLLFSFRQYVFVWETTILPSGFFVAFVESVGWAPCLLGFCAPSAHDIASLANTESVRKAWASWLIGSMIAFGILPRLIMVLLSTWNIRRAFQRLALDCSNPYYLILVQRIRSNFTSFDHVIDPDPGNISSTGPQSPATNTTPQPEGVSLIIPYELREPLALNSSDLAGSVKLLGTVGTYEEQNAVLKTFDTLKVKKVLFVGDAGVSADRGTFRFIRSLQQKVSEVQVVLLHQDEARPQKVANWIDGLHELGFTDLEPWRSMAPAIQWLNTE
jgi:hypothetical protein